MGKAKDLLANINANMVAIASSLGALVTEIDRLEALDKPAPVPAPAPAPTPTPIPPPAPAPVTGLSNIKVAMLAGGLVSLSWDGGAARLVRKSTGGDITNYFVDRSASPYADDHVFAEGEQDAYLLWPLVSGKPDATKQATSGTFTYHAPQPAPAPTPSPAPNPAPGAMRLLPQLPPDTIVPGVLAGLHNADHPDGSTDAWMHPQMLDKYWHEYLRPSWVEIEPLRGRRNWTVVDAAIEGAKSRRRTFGLGIVGFQTQGDYSGTPDFIPRQNGMVNWNSEPWVQGQIDLILDAGRRYANNPYLEWFDGRFWGGYGENNNYPNVVDPMNFDNKKRIIEAMFKAFPASSPVILLAMTDDAEATDYMIARAHELGMPWKVGKRRDSYSNGDGPRPWGFNGYDETGRPQRTQDQWKYAPFIVENGGINFNQNWAKAYLQSQQFRISTHKDQNHGHKYSEWSGPDRDLWERVIREQSGYRLTALELTMPSSVKAGDRLPVTLKWQNSGNAPLYRDYRVQFLFVLPSSATQATRVSSVNLRAMEPGDTNAITDFLPTTGLAAGAYEVRLRAIDVTGVRRPLQLALQNRLPDGSYDLGSLSIV